MASPPASIEFSVAPARLREFSVAGGGWDFPEGVLRTVDAEFFGNLIVIAENEFHSIVNSVSNYRDRMNEVPPR